MAWPEPLPFDSSRAHTITAVGAVLPFIATLTVFGRFYARKRSRAGYGADDWMIIPALLLNYAHTILPILSERYGGVGHHIQDVGPENIEIMYKLLLAVQFLFGTSIGLIKVSICLLLIRVFFTKQFRQAAWAVLAYNVCWMIMVVIVGAALCRPLAYNWDHTIPGGVCGDRNKAYIAIAATDIIGDLMIIALPLPWTLKLDISWPKRLGLSLIFALGFLDIIVAILRIVSLVQVRFEPGVDYTWDLTSTYIWSTIEPNLGIIVANGPLLRPIISDFCSIFFTSVQRSFTGTRASRVSTRISAANMYDRDVPLGGLRRDGKAPNVDGTSYSEDGDSDQVHFTRVEVGPGVVREEEREVERDPGAIYVVSDISMESCPTPSVRRGL